MPSLPDQIQQRPGHPLSGSLSSHRLLMFQVPFENEPAISVDMHVSGAMVASPAHEDVVVSTNLPHWNVTTTVTLVKKGTELNPRPPARRNDEKKGGNPSYKSREPSKRLPVTASLPASERGECYL